MNHIHHHFFGAFLGIWAGYVLHIESINKHTLSQLTLLPLCKYIIYSILIIACSAGLVFILRFANNLRAKNASRLRIYSSLLIGTFAVFTIICYAQGILVDKAFHVSHLHLSLIMPIILCWSVCEEI